MCTNIVMSFHFLIINLQGNCKYLFSCLYDVIPWNLYENQNRFEFFSNQNVETNVNERYTWNRTSEFYRHLSFCDSFRLYSHVFDVVLFCSWTYQYYGCRVWYHFYWSWTYIYRSQAIKPSRKYNYNSRTSLRDEIEKIRCQHVFWIRFRLA